MPFLLFIAFLAARPSFASFGPCSVVTEAAAKAPAYDDSWSGINLTIDRLRNWSKSHPFPNAKTAFLARLAAINGVLSGVAIVPPGFRDLSTPHPSVHGVHTFAYAGTELPFALRMEIRAAWEAHFQKKNPLPDFDHLWMWIGHNIKAEYVGRGFNWAFFEEDPYSHIEPIVYHDGRRSELQSENEAHLSHHATFTSEGVPLGSLSIRTFVGRAVPRYVAKSLDEIRKSGAKGLIFDLRDNGGGGVDEANQIAGYFLGKKQILAHQEDIETRQPVLRSPWLTYTAARIDLPTIILVNGGTASAAEVVAGALQHYGKAYLLGEPTYGNGTVLTPSDVIDDAGPFHSLPLVWTKTTGIYYLPSLRSPQIYGLPIDFVLGTGRPFRREKDQPTAIANAQGPILLREDPVRERLRETLPTLLPDARDDVTYLDPQYSIAVELMKKWLEL